ncbi:MAG: hypothetical protein BWX50_00046 [Euryarchaeota archaeon ADurb.Bin009]|nr:MAG: hypothetical protein BWX50_00046 [Euryarchaeota archaeon ADurb.Bin009]
MMQNEAASGTKICSQMPGQPDVYPNPLTPSRLIPLQIEQTIRIVKTQKPSDLPARM